MIQFIAVPSLGINSLHKVFAIRRRGIQNRQERISKLSIFQITLINQPLRYSIKKYWPYVKINIKLRKRSSIVVTASVV
jgi:hypothetical protein